MHCDIFPRITQLQMVILHSIHCKYEFGILKYSKDVETYCL